MRHYESDTWYDQTGSIIFTSSKGLTGVGLEDTAYSIDSPSRKEKNIALGWEDIRDLKEGTVSKTFMDDTHCPAVREKRRWSMLRRLIGVIGKMIIPLGGKY